MQLGSLLSVCSSTTLGSNLSAVSQIYIQGGVQIVDHLIAYSTVGVADAATTSSSLSAASFV